MYSQTPPHFYNHRGGMYSWMTPLTGGVASMVVVGSPISIKSRFSRIPCVWKSPLYFCMCIVCHILGVRWDGITRAIWVGGQYDQYQRVVAHRGRPKLFAGWRRSVGPSNNACPTPTFPSTLTHSIFYFPLSLSPSSTGHTTFSHPMQTYETLSYAPVTVLPWLVDPQFSVDQTVHEQPEHRLAPATRGVSETRRARTRRVRVRESVSLVPSAGENGHSSVLLWETYWQYFESSVLLSNTLIDISLSVDLLWD